MPVSKPGNEHIVSTYCYQCVAGPDLLKVRIDNGVATEITMNPSRPASISSRPGAAGQTSSISPVFDGKRQCRKAALWTQSSCLVGRNRISLMSTSSGWLIANATIWAKESAGMATRS